MPNFQTYIFNLLPPYFKVTDSYKDVDGKGLLERYLEALGMEWDINLIPKITSMSGVYTDTKFINHQSKNKGGIPQGPLSDVFYQKLVKNWIHLLKIKGTKLCYERIFFLYDPSIVVTITEHFPVGNNRDTGEYDRDDELALRDLFCRNCNNYQVDLEYSSTSIPDLVKFLEDAAFLISLIEPINIKLTAITTDTSFGIPEAYNFSGNETVQISIDSAPLPVYNQEF